MRINVAIPEQHVKAEVLDGALEVVTRLNESLIKSGASPTSTQLIKAGAIWKPEPPGDEHFDHGAKINARGWGDCDDWAPLHAATLRVTGVDPGATARVRKSGVNRWHATVIRSDGTEDDPSVAAGMHEYGRRVGMRGAWMPIMFPRRSAVSGSFIDTPQLALRPVADRHGQLESWQARADLPWHWRPHGSPADVAMVSLHRSPVSSQAIVGAVRGAFQLGVSAGGADPENLKRLSAIAEACEGAPWEELAHRYGPQHADAAAHVVGSFFGKALKGLKKVAKGAVKLAAPAISIVPGGSLATAAFNAAAPGLRKAVLKQQHVKPQARKPVPVVHRDAAPAPRAAAPRAAAPSAPAGGQWLPYPYPVPYPVPTSAWGVSDASSPGMAWPPRG
jgi:hypothetical protein